MPAAQPGFIIDARSNVANVAGQGEVHVNETYPTIVPSYFQSITAASGGTQLESIECARVVVGSVSGNHMMFIGGLDSAAPFSGRGLPLYPGIEGEREMFIENTNRLRICASFSGELVYYMGYVNGQPTAISASTQGEQPNNQPPFLVQTDPLNGEHNVGFQGSGNSFISIFNENIASGTADVDSYSVRLSGDFASVVSGSVDYDDGDRMRVRFISASGELVGSSWYNVYIGQRFADDFGSTLPATLTWSFITAGVDNSPFFLVSNNPVSGTTLAPFSQQITATFSKHISGDVNSTGFTNNIFLWNDNIPALGISGVTILSDVSGRIITFTPNSLLTPGILYRYAVSGVLDQFGAFAPPLSGVAFSTGPADTQGPTVSSFFPVSGAFSGALAPSTLTNIVVTFDERISGVPGGIISGQVIELINSGDTGTKLSGIITLGISGNILTFDPVAELISGTAYRYNISGVFDVNGNVITQTSPPRSGVAFRTATEADVTPPIAVITPSSGSVGISHGINIIATFNETLSGTHPDAAFTAIIAVDLSGTGNVAGVTSTNSSGTVVTFNPTANLSGDRTYFVSVSGAQDLALNRMAPISGHPFRVLDDIPPVVSGITPISGSVDTVLTTNIVVTLSEATSGTANGSLASDVVKLYKSGVGTVFFAGTRTLDSTRTVITFDPSSDLDPNEHYQVGITGIVDVSGNAMVAGGRVSGHSFFTTGGPVITSTIPASGTGISGLSGVALASNLVITFNKALSGTANASVSHVVTKLWLSHGTIFSGLPGVNTLNSDKTQLTFNPTSDLLDSRWYNFAISGVRDLSGNVITQTNPPRSGFSFRTFELDVTPPTVASTVPASGTSGVLTTTTYIVNFSETVSGNSGSVMPVHTVRLAVSGLNILTSGVSGVITKTTDNQFTFVPSANLSGDRWYQAAVTGVYDLSLNIMTPRSGLSFRTVDDIAPGIVSIAPSSGQANVIATDNIVVTFNEVISGTLGGSITAGVISLIKQSVPGTPLAGATTLDATGKILTFNPTANLSYNTIHEVSVSGVRDKSDNFMVPVSGHPFTSQLSPLTTAYENVGTNPVNFGSASPVLKAAGIFRENSSSILNGEVIKRASVKMNRSGTNAGTVECVIISDIDPGGGDNGLEVVIGTAAFNSISTTAGRVVFENLTNNYALTTDDWIGVRFSGSNASTCLTVYTSADNVDGSDTQYAQYDTNWDSDDAKDLDAKLET